jgi:hypothetical protein
MTSDLLYYRAAIRPWVLFHVERGVQRNEQLQALRQPLLMSFCSWCQSHSNV